MKIYSGDSLKNYLEKAVDIGYKKRFLYSQLYDYINKKMSPELNSKVCCLYGMRRTGKTVMMHQAMREINNYEKTLLLHCESDEDSKQYDTGIPLPTKLSIPTR